MTKRRRRCDMWPWLPPELLVEVFRRLDATDVVHCTGACKPWRRAIIGNASCLQPHPDCFVPSLLLGFLYRCNKGVLLKRAPGPLQSTIPAITGGEKEGSSQSHERLCDLIPAASTGGVDLALYDWPLSSRDSFLLLASLIEGVDDLCLCNLTTGACTLLPVADFEADTYVLVTGYDLAPTPSESNDDTSVLVVAVKIMEYHDRATTLQYQHFSTTPESGAGGGSGSWGPVKRSHELDYHVVLGSSVGSEVVSGGAIYWLAKTVSIMDRYSLAAMEVRTGRTWTTRIPWQCLTGWNIGWYVLAATSDGQLSILRCVKLKGSHGDQIQVWVHIHEEQWMLRRTIDMPSLSFLNDMFFPRSGCLLVADKRRQALLIDVETRSPHPIMYLNATVPIGVRSCYPYEMDWSTYLSKFMPFATAPASDGHQDVIGQRPKKKRLIKPNLTAFGPDWVM